METFPLPVRTDHKIVYVCGGGGGGGGGAQVASLSTSNILPIQTQNSLYCCTCYSLDYGDATNVSFTCGTCDGKSYQSSN